MEIKQPFSEIDFGTVTSISAGSGITLTPNPITATGTISNNLITGISGGQTAIGGTAVTDILKLQGTSGNGTLTSPAIQLLVGNAGATTALTILNNGNVGIGTTPSHKLDILGNSASIIQQVGLKNVQGSFGAGNSMGFYIASTVEVGRIESVYDASGSGVLKFYTYNGTLNEAMRINNSGYVGIGTTTLDTPLTIYSSTGSATNDFIKFRSVDNGAGDYMAIGKASGFTNDMALGTWSNNNLRFYTNSIEYMRLTNGGNVGIGTTTATNILSFGGNAARTIWMENHTTSNTAGNSLTVQAGGATAVATDKAGGDLIISSGISTGTGGSNVYIKTATPATTGTANNAPSTKITIQGNGVLLPFQAATASAPAYVLGGMYFDTTLNKLRIGGATAWETVTSI